MARKLRVEYPGAIYHVMSRGDHREPIFRDETDRRCFLATLAEACRKTDWQIHAFCLMGNHFHVVVETPPGNLVGGMKWLLGVYTSRFNRRHKLFGHLFSGRYKSLVVDGSGKGYLKTVCDYVHLNPARAGLIAAEAALAAYDWSSYPQYLQAPEVRPAWLRTDRLLGEWRIPEDSAAGRAAFAAMMEVRRASALDEEFKPVPRGWGLGSETFREELLAQVSEQRGAWHYGAELMESAEVKAERLVCAELDRLGWAEADLAGRRKGDRTKLKLAAMLRAKTTVTLEWIAKRLGMGTRGHLTHLLYHHERAAAADTPQVELWEKPDDTID